MVEQKFPRSSFADGRNFQSLHVGKMYEIGKETMKSAVNRKYDFPRQIYSSNQIPEYSAGKF